MNHHDKITSQQVHRDRREYFESMYEYALIWTKWQLISANSKRVRSILVTHQDEWCPYTGEPISSHTWQVEADHFLPKEKIYEQFSWKVADIMYHSPFNLYITSEKTNWTKWPIFFELNKPMSKEVKKLIKQKRISTQKVLDDVSNKNTNWIANYNEKLFIRNNYYKQEIELQEKLEYELLKNI